MWGWQAKHTRDTSTAAEVSAQLHSEEGAATPRLGVLAASNGVGFIQGVARAEMRFYEPGHALESGLWFQTGVRVSCRNQLIADTFSALVQGAGTYSFVSPILPTTYVHRLRDFVYSKLVYLVLALHPRSGRNLYLQMHCYNGFSCTPFILSTMKLQGFPSARLCILKGRVRGCRMNFIFRCSYWSLDNCLL